MPRQCIHQVCRDGIRVWGKRVGDRDKLNAQRNHLTYTTVCSPIHLNGSAAGHGTIWAWLGHQVDHATKWRECQAPEGIGRDRPGACCRRRIAGKRRCVLQNPREC